MTFTLEARNLGKAFNRQVIFHDVSFDVGGGQTLLVTGRNGSGKSTLLKILAHVLTPSTGAVSIRSSGSEVRGSARHLIGFVSPYLNLYDEFSARENLQFALAIRGMKNMLGEIDRLLERVSLGSVGDAPVRVFSSGMKQRLKYAFALIHHPPLLFLDEPMANLDQEGRELVQGMMAEHDHNGLLVVATNDMSDVLHSHVQVRLDAYR
jgi:heme exporter protein A